MRICFLTQYYPISDSARSLYSDLMDEISSFGHEITVFRSEEQKALGYPAVSWRKNVKVVSVPTGRVTKTNIITKALNILLTEPRYLAAMKKHYGDNHPDMVIITTPPITFCSAASYFAKKGSIIYLLLKDIFPQNAVDLGMMKKKGLIYSFFRTKEKTLYKNSDVIGCMSEANKRYLLHHNPFLKKKIIEINPNSIKPSFLQIDMKQGEDLLEEYKIPKGKIKIIYGGNLGKPQGIDFLLEVLNKSKEIENVHFVICGSGTEYPRLEKFVKTHPDHPVTLIEYLENSKYRSFLSRMDIGLIFLDRRFTIPNFPQRILDYFDFSLPVLAATDTYTDLGSMLVSKKCGLWSESGNIEAFMKNLEYLISNPEIRISMGKNGRELIDSEFSVEKSAQMIVEKFKLPFGAGR